MAKFAHKNAKNITIGHIFSSWTIIATHAYLLKII